MFQSFIAWPTPLSSFLGGWATFARDDDDGNDGRKEKVEDDTCGGEGKITVAALDEENSFVLLVEAAVGANDELADVDKLSFTSTRTSEAAPGAGGTRSVIVFAVSSPSSASPPTTT